MNVSSLLTQGAFDQDFQLLANQSWVLIEHPDLRRLSQELLLEARALGPLMHPAQIGRGPDSQRNEKIRSDNIIWQEFKPEHEAFQLLESLKMIFNQSFYLGLSDWEAHFAHYPAGGHYDWHLDKMRKKGLVERVMTFVFYLNPEWPEGSGGEFEIRGLPPISPIGGRLLLFRSDIVEHQVRLSHRDRWSLTGWFLRSSL
jgi:SM-20-related protein